MSRARVAVLKVISKELSVTDAAAQYGYSRQHLSVLRNAACLITVGQSRRDRNVQQ